MKNKMISIVFMVFLITILVFNIISPAGEISFAERRFLKQYNELDYTDFLKGDFMERFDAVALDQFIFRDHLRSLKAIMETKIFQKTDNNNILVKDDGVFKIEYPMNTGSVDQFIKYVNKVYTEYLQESKVYFSLIPDKSYFLEDNMLKMDYDQLEKMLTAEIRNMTYIDIKEVLSLEDYYLTDPHWKQENLAEVIQRLGESMDFEVDMDHYTRKEFFPFYGAYYGQSALTVKPDTLTFLYNENIAGAIVKNYEKTEQISVYDEKKLDGMDPYDLFLSGASPLITIENPKVNHQKELIIFRDSFSSSLAPLLIDGYKKITLIDLRYMSHDLLDEYVEFDGKDVLFMYSTLIVNNSNILK